MANRATFDFPSKEFELLSHLTRDIEDPLISHAPHLFDQVDWDRFNELMNYHRVDGLVGSSVSAFPDWPVPDQVRKTFSRRQRRMAVSRLTNLATTRAISKLLTDGGVRHILMKGPAVGERYYDASSIRRSIDIDYWISAGDLIRARDLLIDAGYIQTVPDFDLTPDRVGAVTRLVNAIGLSSPENKCQLDLHWRLHDNYHRLNWSFKEIYKRATPLTISAHDIMVMNDIDQQVYLYTHGAKHAWFRLKWLADIYRARRRLSAAQLQEIHELAKASGASKMRATGDAFTDMIYLRDKPADNLSVGMRRYICERLSRTSKETVITTGSFFDLPRQIIYKMGLRSELKYKLTTLFHHLANLNDVPRLNLSKRYYLAYVICGPILGVFRLLGRSLDGRKSPEQNTGQTTRPKETTSPKVTPDT